MSRVSPRRPGVALLLVLWVVVVLGSISTGVVRATRSSSDVASNYRARVVARYAGESGVTLAVAALEERLAGLGSGSERQEYLNHLERALDSGELSLGDARLAVVAIDVGSRLDLNYADIASLTRLFAFFTDGAEAGSAARAIRSHLGGTENGESPPRLLESLDELSRVPGLRRQLIEQAAPYLTVDGDGTINRATASDTVLAAATGQLRDEPARIMIVSRGWLNGHALTHELQAVYAINGNELTLVRWRESDR